MAELIHETTDQVHGEVRSTMDKEQHSEVCEPCKVDNNTQQAYGWCETCDEMLCNHCFKIHCRPTITRNHQLRSLEEREKRKKTKKFAIKCQIHEGKKLNYYCEDHTELSCGQCFFYKHRQCRKVVCISKHTTSESTEFNALQLLLSKLENRLQTIEEKMERDVSTTGRQHDEAIVGIQEAGEKLKALIDTLVQEQIAKAEMTKDDNIRTIGKNDGLKKGVEEELTTAKDMLATAKYDNNQLFVTMKYIQEETKVMESKLGDSEQNHDIKEYEFVLNPQFARLLDTVTELGAIKNTRELNMEKSTDEAVDVIEVRRLKQVHCGGGYSYDGRRPEAIQMSTDRDIRLLYVLLYPCKEYITNVKLGIKEGSKWLISCTSTHAYTDEDVVAVKVVGDGGVHGITLQAGHRYDVIVTIMGDLSDYGYEGLAEVSEQGVKFHFSDANVDSETCVEVGQIPGFRFSLM